MAKLYGPLVYAWCRRGGLKAEDAEDVVQEVFRAVARSIQDFKAAPDGSFRGWLRTITRNKITDHFRNAQGQAKAVGGTDALVDLHAIPETLDESIEGSDDEAKLVRRALEMIRPDFEEKTWEAFRRVAMEGQPVALVAHSLGISGNAVRIAKSRVLQRLRDELGEDFLSDGESPCSPRNAQAPNN
jgi:RNA polymerase sigma-70 factor (ECF subfamily)